MNKVDNISPPIWAGKFLKLYCRNDILEEIQGDVHELFLKRIKEEGTIYAKRRFIWDVLRFFRLSNIINSNKIQFSSNTTDMIKNYFKVGFRNILKNKLPSAINIFGLSLAIGVAIVAFLFLDWQYNLDSFHQNSKNIYQLSSFMNVDGEVDEWGITPEPLGNAMKSDIPSIVASSRVDIVSGIFSYEDKVFNERVQFVDPEFMEIFSFPIIIGRRDALKEKNAIIISEELAKKYFGEADPIGKQVTLTFAKRIKETFFVKAVSKNLENSSFPFNILISYQLKNDIEIYEDTDDWRNFADATFIQLEEGSTPSEVTPLLNRYRQLQNEANGKWLVEKFEMIPLEDLSERSFAIRSAISFGNQPHGNLSIAIIAILLMILACLNYMNVAIVSATTRLKEIALRKVIGGRKTEIIIQFLTENILLCSFSLLVGLGLAYYLLLPGFNSGFPFTVPFEFSSNVVFFSFFGGILLFTAIISGAYPAFYISSFSPVNIFSGKMKFGRKSWITKIFLTFQFMVAFWVMVAGFIFTEASTFFRNKDWGYNQEAILVIPIEGDKHFLELKNKFAQNPDIISVAGSRQHIGRSAESATIKVGTDKHLVTYFDIGFDYLETMSLRLASGRYFKEEIESDKTEHVIVNQKFVEKLNWDNPLEQSFWHDSTRYSVIGVIEDFHYRIFYYEITPAFMRITGEANFNFIASKVQSGSIARSRDFMKQTWKETDPDLPYEGFIQNEVFDNFFDNVDANVTVMRFVSILALILACMGLFGLVAFNINRRMKEFSIRKILGANMMVIAKSISNNFIWILIIAMILGAPLGYLTMDGLLSMMFAEREPFRITPFVVSVGVILLTAIVTVSTQVIKVAKTNPVDMIRNE